MSRGICLVIVIPFASAIRSVNELRVNIVEIDLIAAEEDFEPEGEKAANTARVMKRVLIVKRSKENKMGGLRKFNV